MEVKTLARSNTITMLNKKATLRPSQTKLIKKNQTDAEKDIKEVELFIFADHHAAKFLRGSTPDKTQFKKFVTLLYRGLSYSVNNLKGPSEEFIKKKRVKLPQPQDSKKKFLMLDLDETLIHSVFSNEKTDVKFVYKSDEFKFNIRPYCLQFLEAMSQHYTVYVFTAGTQDYAEPIVEYLNKKKRTIQGVLHRKNCMQTHNGFYIKDLRIIQNRDLKDILIVDNLVHSFGLQLTNGVPILEFLDNKKDRELLGLQNFLRELSEVEDVRPHLKDRIQLHQCLQINENDFVTIDEESKSKS